MIVFACCWNSAQYPCDVNIHRKAICIDGISVMSNPEEPHSTIRAIKPKHRWTPFQAQCAAPTACGLKNSPRKPPLSEFQRPDKSIPDWQNPEQLRLAYKQALARWNLERSSYSSPDPSAHTAIDIQGGWEAAIEEAEEAERAEKERLRLKDTMSCQTPREGL
jgi:hypothetical protein